MKKDKLVDTLLELATRITMNFIKLIVGAAIGIAYISIQYQFNFTIHNGTPEFQTASAVLVMVVLIMSLIENFVDWEIIPARKAKGKELAADATGQTV